MKNQHVTGFLEFIREQGVVGLAIGFVLGGSITQVVKSLVEDILNPLIGIVGGGTAGLASAMITVGTAQIKYGQFISVLINFVLIAAIVYFVFKGLGLDRIDKKKDK
ncbi:MscL family protein [Candidatus Woesebacteria bacterium]|nr:MscL family protein [Candidatus Woesebacteria bacterium]